MRFLDTYTGQSFEKDPKGRGFRYAILSHTWESHGEQTYHELRKIQREYAGECPFPAENDFKATPLSAIWEDPRLSPKIRDACAVARKGGYRYIWIDSCCIDKTSSSELSEAINSMYMWYEGANVCYAYLADVSPDDDPWKVGSSFRGSRWFKRGWTLQELLAPAPGILIFLSRNWTVLGSKEAFAELLKDITGISVNALSNPLSISKFSVAQRLSWASNRETTRVEDRAYSLLGIFDISMPTLYGEGERAFHRLQEEIMRRIPDQSIFAFSDSSNSPRIYCVDHGFKIAPFELSDKSVKFKCSLDDLVRSNSLLPSSPDNFLNAERVPLGQLVYHYPDLPPLGYSFTPHGIRMHIPLIPLSAFQSDIPIHCQGKPSEWYLAVLGCEHADYPGRLLARVCHLTLSASGINFLTRGSISHDMHVETRWEPISFLRSQGDPNSNCFFALSVKALVQSSPQTRVLPVHLSHSKPNHTSGEPFDEDMLKHPHKTMNLMLKKNVSSGPSGCSSNVEDHATTLNLRWPNQDHPDTHRLQISRPRGQGTGDVQDTIIVEYRHTLENCGSRVTIVAHVGGTIHGHPIIPVTVKWSNLETRNITFPDRPLRKSRRAILDNEKGGMGKVKLSLEYLAPNHYLIDAHTTWFDEKARLEPEDGNIGEPVPSEDRAKRSQWSLAKVRRIWSRMWI